MRPYAAMLAMIQRDITADLRDYKVTIARLILQPAVYIFVFGHVIGGFFSVARENYSEIVIPGIIAIAVMNSSFSSAGGSIITGYYFRSMEGWLLSPVGLRMLMTARVFSGLLYGTVSGIVVAGLAWGILGIYPKNFIWLLMLIISGSLFFSLLTITLFLIPERPDKGQEAFSFLLMPMTFFGCTFYSYSMLQEPFSYVALVFPTTYLSEGLRAAYNPDTLHINNSSILAGLFSGLIVLFYVADRVFHKRFRDFLW